MMSATCAPAAMAPTRTRTKVLQPTPVSEPIRDGANPLASGPGHTGHIIGQCIDARKKAALGGTAWILLKAAVSPRTRPFPEPAPRRG
jgi:hypothetical protein